MQFMSLNFDIVIVPIVSHARNILGYKLLDKHPNVNKLLNCILSQSCLFLVILEDYFSEIDIFVLHCKF